MAKVIRDQAKIKQLCEKAIKVKVYTACNDLIGESSNKDKMVIALDEHPWAELLEFYDGKYHLAFNPGLWYEFEVI